MDTLPAPISSPPPESKSAKGLKHVKSTGRKWPAGSIQHWTIPVLKRLSHHFPAAINRIGEIVNDPEHKDNFAACKLVVETLVRDGKTRGANLDTGGIRIVVEMAHGKEEKLVIENGAETVS